MMISKAAISFFLAASAQGAWARLNKAEVGDRKLQELSIKMEWPECAADGLSVEACKTLIENEVLAHHLPNIEVQINYPRAALVFNESYWKVGIQTSIEGIVVGQGIDGVIRWSGIWEGTGELASRFIGDWTCGNWNPVQCCDTIKANVPDKDLYGNFLECYVTQDDPAPYVKADDTVGYCSWAWDDTAKVYNPVAITLADLEAADTFAKSMLRKNINHCIAYLRDGIVAYNMLAIVNNSCHFYGRANRNVQASCNAVDKVLRENIPDSTIEVNPDIEVVLTKLKNAIIDFVDTPYEAHHKVVIYATNESGDFVEGHPKIGGNIIGPECIPL